MSFIDLSVTHDNLHDEIMHRVENFPDLQTHLSAASPEVIEALLVLMAEVYLVGVGEPKMTRMLNVVNADRINKALEEKKAALGPFKTLAQRDVEFHKTRYVEGESTFLRVKYLGKRIGAKVKEFYGELLTLDQFCHRMNSVTNEIFHDLKAKRQEIHFNQNDVKITGVRFSCKPGENIVRWRLVTEFARGITTYPVDNTGDCLMPLMNDDEPIWVTQNTGCPNLVVLDNHQEFSLIRRRTDYLNRGLDNYLRMVTILNEEFSLT